MKKGKVKKQMKRNKWLALAMAAVMGGSLFGCSGDASSVASGSGPMNLSPLPRISIGTTVLF